MNKIGIMFGMENTFPPALVERINSMTVDGVTAEFVKLGGVKMAEPSGYRVIIDRISQDIPFYRAYLKNAELSGTIVINNPAAICAPATIDITATAVTTGSDAGLTYTYWTNAGGTISYATPTTAGAGTYYIKAINPVTKCSIIKPVEVVVNPLLTPSVSIAANPGSTICSNSSVTFTPTPVNGGVYAGGYFTTGSHVDYRNTTAVAGQDGFKLIGASEARAGDVILRPGTNGGPGHMGIYTGQKDNQGRYLALDMGGRSPRMDQLLSNWGPGSTYKNTGPITFYRPMVPTTTSEGH